MNEFLENHMKKVFLFIAIQACFTCFQRADFDLPIFLFAYLLWNFTPNPQIQRKRLVYLFIFTLFIDLIWLIYWGTLWHSDEYQSNNSVGKNNFVLYLSVIKFIQKIILVAIIVIKIENAKPQLNQIGSDIKSIFIGNNNKNL